MQPYTFLTAFLFSIAASAFSGQAYEITNLCVTANSKANTTLSFTVHDPDTLSNQTAACSGTWSTKANNFPQGSHVLCPNSTFAWTILSDTFSPSSFVLGVEHQIEDPSVGEPPYDQVLNFASANITKSVLRCTKALNKCAEPKGKTIIAPIYASVA